MSRFFRVRDYHNPSWIDKPGDVWVMESIHGDTLRTLQVKKPGSAMVAFYQDIREK